jgi:hypothetical protein
MGAPVDEVDEIDDVVEELDPPEPPVGGAVITEPVQPRKARKEHVTSRSRIAAALCTGCARGEISRNPRSSFARRARG